MADINHIISLGLGSPAAIPELLTLGLQISGEAVGDATLTRRAPIRTMERASQDNLTRRKPIRVFLGTDP